MKQAKSRPIWSLLAGLTTAISFLLSACGGGDVPEKPSAKADPASGSGQIAEVPTGEPLIFSVPADFTKMDPPQPTDGITLCAIYHIYDRLVDFADEKSVRIVPGLAKSWDVTPDGLKYTFHLRDDATFSDGTPVRAEAVKFTFERIVDPNHPAHFATAWQDSILSDWFDHIETPDELTVVFVLKRPYVPLLANLSIPAASIVSPAHVLKVGSDGVVSKPMGSGPYVLDEWNSGNYIRLKARPNHWRGKPRTDTIIMRVQKDMNQRMASLRKGEVHLVTVLSPGVVGDASKLEKCTIATPSHLALCYAAFNMKVDKLKSKELRIAMNLAVDRKTLCEGVMEGAAFPATGVIPPGMLGYREEKPFGFSYQPDKAKKMIDDAGLAGTKIKMLCFVETRPYNVAGTKTAQRLQEDWRKIGIDVELVQMDFGGFLETMNMRNKHEMAMTGWMSDNGDPDNFVYELFGSPMNKANYANEAANDLMAKAKGEQDVRKRADLYAQAEDLILQDPPAVMINHANRIVGYSNRLRGYNPENMMMEQLWNVYLVKE